MPELGRFGNTFAHLAEKYPLFGIVESLSALDGQAHGALFSFHTDGTKMQAAPRDVSVPPARKRELKGRLPQPRPVKQFLGIAGEREDVAPLDVLYVEFPVQGGEVAQP